MTEHFIRGLWLKKGAVSLKAFAILYALWVPHGLPHGAIVKCYGTVHYVTPTRTGQRESLGEILLYKIDDATPKGFFVQINSPAKHLWCMSTRDLGKQKVLVYGAW